MACYAGTNNSIYKLRYINTFKPFPFSANPETEAARINGQISKKIIHKRLSELIKILLQHKHRFYKEHIRGMPSPLLSEIAYIGLRSIRKLEMMLSTPESICAGFRSLID